MFSSLASGALLATGKSDGTVDVYLRRTSDADDSAGNGSRTNWYLGCRLTDHIGPVFRCSWCAVRMMPILATVGADRLIQVYHFQRAMHDNRVILEPKKWSITRGHEKDLITDVAFVPPGQSRRMILLSTASLDGRVRVYEVKANAPLERVAAWRPDPIYGDTTHAQVCGVSALSWFQGRSEPCMTIAVGTLSGKVATARCTEDKAFEEILMSPNVRCSGSVLHVEWAPALGRRFILLAACSRSEVVILRFNVISPSYLKVDSAEPVEVFRIGVGACSVSWTHSGTMLLLASDEVGRAVGCLQMADPTNHQKWNFLRGEK